MKLGQWVSIPTTYAGGARTLDDLRLVYTLGQGKLDLTIGSALDIFGGSLNYEKVLEWFNTKNKDYKGNSSQKIEYTEGRFSKKC